MDFGEQFIQMEGIEQLVVISKGKEGLWVYSHRNGEIASKINYKENIPEDGYHIIYETAPIMKMHIQKVLF